MKVAFLAPVLPAGDKLRGTSIKEIAENYGKFPPLGLLRLASNALKAGHDVKVIDAIATDASIEEVSTSLQAFGVEVLCVTLITQVLPHTLAQLKVLKDRLGCTIIAGGPNISLYPAETMENAVVDYGIQGSAEHSLISLLDAIQKNNSLREVPSLLYRDSQGKLLQNPPSTKISSLATAPWAAGFLLDLTPYHSLVSQHQPYTSMVTSPSCPYRCNFCEQGRTFVEPMPAKLVVAELAALSNNQGVKEVEMFDPTFTLDKERTKDICEGIIERGLDIKWAARTRVDMVDENLLYLMARAGCIRVYFGIESGNDRILKHYQKDLTVSKARKAVAWAKITGIHVFGFFMIGAQEETEETIRQTIALAKDLDLDYAQFNKVVAAPHTPLFNENFSEEDYWSPTTVLSDALPTVSNDFTEAELEVWVRQAYWEFYFRPKYIIKALRRSRSLGEIIRAARVALLVIAHMGRGITSKILPVRSATGK